MRPKWNPNGKKIRKEDRPNEREGGVPQGPPILELAELVGGQHPDGRFRFRFCFHGFRFATKVDGSVVSRPFRTRKYAFPSNRTFPRPLRGALSVVHLPSSLAVVWCPRSGAQGWWASFGTSSDLFSLPVLASKLICSSFLSSSVSMALLSHLYQLTTFGASSRMTLVRLCEMTY